MASEKRINQVILGLLCHEPMTGYEIKKSIDTTLHYFWSGSYGSIYPTLNSLEKEGYVTVSENTETSRKKLVYSITSDGRECLHKWLKEPVVKDELKYETLLKLFFGGELGVEGTITHINRFEENIRLQLPFLEMCTSNLEKVVDEEDHLYYLLTVKFGIETYKSYLKWCEEAKSILFKCKNDKILNQSSD